MLPLRGCSSYELTDGPFVDAEADAALFDAIRANLRRDIDLREVDANVNDHAAADEILGAFLELYA